MVQGRRHWNTIDFIKGLLIILVFWGHLIVGEQRTTFLRYVIYSFHMPLFFVLSGFVSVKILQYSKMTEYINYIKSRATRVRIPF